MRTGLFLIMDTYYPHRAKARSWGAVSETVEVEPGTAPVSTALAIVLIFLLMSRVYADLMIRILNNFCV